MHILVKLIRKYERYIQFISFIDIFGKICIRLAVYEKKIHLNIKYLRITSKDL